MLSFIDNMRSEFPNTLAKIESPLVKPSNIPLPFFKEDLFGKSLAERLNALQNLYQFIQPYLQSIKQYVDKYPEVMDGYRDKVPTEAEWPTDVPNPAEASNIELVSYAANLLRCILSKEGQEVFAVFTERSFQNGTHPVQEQVFTERSFPGGTDSVQEQVRQTFGFYGKSISRKIFRYAIKQTQVDLFKQFENMPSMQHIIDQMPPNLQDRMWVIKIQYGDSPISGPFSKETYGENIAYKLNALHHLNKKVLKQDDETRKMYIFYSVNS